MGRCGCISVKPSSSVCDLGGEVGELLHLSNLDDLVRTGRAALGPLDGLFARAHLDHPVAAEDFFHFGKGAVGDVGLAAVEGDAGSHRRWVQAVERKQHARLLERFVVLHHRGDRFGGGHRARLRRLVAFGNHQHHESHGVYS